MQYFKGDDIEKKYVESGKQVMDLQSAQKDAFFSDAYNCQELGQILYDSGRAPLANAIPEQIFRETFAEVFNSFQMAGSFESYLSIFRKIFGEQVDVTFTIADYGHLQIDIESSGNENFPAIVRQIESNEYVLYNLIDDEDDNIVFTGVKGFESQYDLEQMLKEFVPAGIFSEITLTII